MFKGKMKGRAAIAAASLLVAGGAAMSAASPAEASVVPNRFYCDLGDHWCYQVNGPFQPGIIIECHAKLSGMAGTPHQLHDSACDRWGPVVL